MDLNRLTQGEKILGASSALLLILSFISLWAKYEVAGAEELGIGQARFNAWDGFGAAMDIALILFLVALGVVIVRALGTNVNLPLPAGQIYLGLAGIGTVLVLISVITGPYGQSGLGLEVSRGPLLFVGLVLAIAAAYGAWSHMQEEGSAPDIAGPRPPSGGGPATGGPPGGPHVPPPAS